MTAIEARGLSKVYCDGARRLEILKNVSFEIKQGEGVVILGPSGSGKSTLLNLLSGLDRPTEGRVVFLGRLLESLSDAQSAVLRNQDFGFVFQFYHLLPELTALENVMLPMVVRGGNKDRRQVQERAQSLIEKVGLKDRCGHYPDELSGGEQQRVAIARALANDPKIVFCDEPTGNLDVGMGRQIIGLLQDLHRREKKTVVIVTHDERIANGADKVWDIVRSGWRKNEP